MVLPVPEAWSRAEAGPRCAPALLADPFPSPSRLQYNDGGDTTTTSYLYNAADQLTRETVGETVTTYLYDANGNLTKKDDGANVHSYAYDFRNLMSSYDGPGTSNDSTYKYDASGRRITKNVDGTKTAYFHDGLNVGAEYNGSNQLQRTYVTPGLDQNLTMTASGSTYYYLTDALGSARQLIDGNESTQNSYDYFAFGKVYGTPTENVPQPFRYTARAWDGETALYHYRNRAYEPGASRFSGRDGIELLGSYTYVRNCPTLFIDPLGLNHCESDLNRNIYPRVRDWALRRPTRGLPMSPHQNELMRKALCLLKEAVMWNEARNLTGGDLLSISAHKLRELERDLEQGRIGVADLGNVGGYTPGANRSSAEDYFLHEQWFKDDTSSIINILAIGYHEHLHMKYGAAFHDWFPWHSPTDYENAIRAGLRTLDNIKVTVCCPDGHRKRTNLLDRSACKCGIDVQHTCPCATRENPRGRGCIVKWY